MRRKAALRGNLSLRQAMDAAKERHRIQYDDCMALLRANRRRVQSLETCTADVQKRLQNVEKSLLSQREEGVGVHELMIKNNICALHEQFKSQVTDDLDIFQSDIAYLAEKIDHLQSAGGFPMAHQPCISAPNVCPIMNSEVDVQQQRNHTQFTSTAASILKEKGDINHPIANMTSQVGSNVFMAPGEGEQKEFQQIHMESCQQKEIPQRLCNSESDGSESHEEAKSYISEFMPSPKRYDGTTNIDSYEMQFIFFANNARWTPTERLHMFAILLDGKALDYYVSNKPGHGDYNSIEEVFSKFRARFGRAELPQSLRSEFQTLCQRSEETINDWADRVHSMASDAFDGMADNYVSEETVRCFCQGLFDKETAAFVGSKLPTDLSTAVQAVKEYICNKQAVYKASRKVHENRETRTRSVSSEDLQITSSSKFTTSVEQSSDDEWSPLNS